MCLHKWIEVVAAVLAEGFDCDFLLGFISKAADFSAALLLYKNYLYVEYYSLVNLFSIVLWKHGP